VHVHPPGDESPGYRTARHESGWLWSWRFVTPILTSARFFTSFRMT